MPAAALDKVFQRFHAAHDATARTVVRQQSSPAGSKRIWGGPSESGKRLQALILRYDALAACAPAAYQGKAGRHGVHSEVALRLKEALTGALPALRRATQGHLQE